MLDPKISDIQIEVLEESKIMIPDCKRRLKTAYNELTNLVAETEKDFGTTEEHKTAKEMMETTVLED
ncbi:Tubulin-specific chaperone A [Stylophora pistillata]|uniref:Tubulin-specific chaperone A n=1 Tax=Stylophora pistillata TaxID=50429 RepID=A0A2B4SM71_STYPI|nr:Tubulin-specific chaperone A [Stylophora pistillata]